MATFTSVTVLHAADNLLARLKVIHDNSISHAHQFQAYRTQLSSLRALQARLGGPPSSVRVKTMEKVTRSMDEAVQSLHEDLREMSAVLQQLSDLPKSALREQDVERLSAYTQAHAQHLARKHALLNICMNEEAIATGTEEDHAQWMEAWKAGVVVEEARKEEMDDLANALGSW